MRNPLYLLTELRQDTTYALRTFWRNPGFVAVAALSLAIGIAANATIFSVANALLFGNLAVREPERLVSIGNTVHGFTFSYADYLDFQKDNKSLEGIAATFPIAPASLGGVQEPERIWGQMVSGNYFDVVQPPMAAGRGFMASEDTAPGQHPVAVLSYSLWQRHFGRDPGVLGKTIVLNNAPYTIVGVTGEGFHGTQRALMPEYFVPLAMATQLMPNLGAASLRENHHAQWISLDGRLKPGISRTQAIAELNVVNERIDHQYKPKDPPSRIRMIDAGGLPSGGALPMQKVMMVVMAVVGLVLLIACANVANLLLARASARQKEVAVRLAVGAGRGRLVRQLLTESVLLALAGAAGGMLLTVWATRALGSLELPLPIPLALNFLPDLRVFAYVAGVAVLSGILFGLAPALRATRTDLISATKDDGAAFGNLRRFSLRHALVVVQVAGSLALLVAAGLSLKSLRAASTIDLGMRLDHVLMLSVDPRLHNYSTEASRRFFSELRARASAIPGVQGVSYTDVAPLSISGVSMGFHTRTGEDSKPELIADVYTVGDGYFDVIGTPLLRGSGFQGQKASEPMVAVVNEAFAKKMYPNVDPIGRTAFDGTNTYRIIGVSHNAASHMLRTEATPCLFRSIDQGAGVAADFVGITVIVRTTGEPSTYAAALREQVRALDRNMAVFNLETMDRHLSKALLLPRLAGALFTMLGTAGLILAMVGLYGVMSYLVRRRTREIGIRLALGANRIDLMRLVAGQGMAMVGIGVAIGLAMAFGAAKLLASVLFEANATEATMFIAVPAALVAVAALAIWVPARRAANADPLTALRYE